MSVENLKPLNGEDAYIKILSKLCGNSLAEKLAEEVFNFYGEFLTYSESRETLSSKFNIDIQHEPFIFLKAASILLKLDTGRESEALAHELLHLQLAIRGFPFIEGSDIPEDLNQEFAKTYNSIQNLVHHEINIANFKALGYLKRHFLGPDIPRVSGEYREMVLNPPPNTIYDSRFGFSWWCFEFFRNWISMRHGKTFESKAYADEALHWGSKLHPTLKQATAGIMDWVKCGTFKDSDEYVQQVNNLLDIMQIPRVTMWALLECPTDQKPIARRITI